MPTATPWSALCLAGAAALAGCAHRPAAPPPAAARTAWPEGAVRPRARWVGSLPAAADGRPGFWSRAGAALLGTDPSAPGPAASLRRPYGIALAQGALAVADPDAPGLFRLAPHGPPEAITCPRHPWVAPMAVAAAPGGALLVADPGAGALVRVEAGGSCAVLAAPLVRAVGVAAAQGRVYAVDAGAHAVLVLDEAGSVLERFGHHGEDGAGLNFPVAAAVAADGSVLVVDALNFRVARFSASGDYLGAIGAAAGAADPVLGRPKGVAASPEGQVYVSDEARDAVLVFGADGVLEYTIGASGNGPSDLARPAGLAYGEGRLYVADSGNQRIQVFEILGDST